METLRALVIDDEKIVLDSVEKILSAENYEVHGIQSGKKGIKMALRDPWDVVLTDIRMPDIGGLIVLRDIKREKPALPVIIITGYASVSSAVQAMQLGASDYITKPFTPGQLTAPLTAAIEQAKKQEPEVQAIVHKEEVLRVLDRAATDNLFRQGLLQTGTDTLSEYKLTGPEKLAISGPGDKTRRESLHRKAVYTGTVDRRRCPCHGERRRRGAMGAKPDPPQGSLEGTQERIGRPGLRKSDFFYLGPEALDGYKLTAQEKLAIITADTAWIEDQIGTLKPKHKEWLERNNE